VHRHCGANIDAVQLEFGSSWRRTHVRRCEIAEVVATAIFYQLQPLVPFIAQVAARRSPIWNEYQQSKVISKLQVRAHIHTLYKHISNSVTLFLLQTVRTVHYCLVQECTRLE
jgi:hypothetical protein